MKKVILMVIPLFILSYMGCVQKAYDRTVVYTFITDGTTGIQTVGIRGNDKPLNWNEDFDLTPIKPDSLYRAVITYKTGYLFTEVKFTVNGEFELQNSPNRRVEFSSTDTTYYEAIFKD